MLGTRRYKTVAIDLWQGSFFDFSSDILVISHYEPHMPLTFSKINQIPENFPAPRTFQLHYPSMKEASELWSKQLKNIPVDKRHLAIAFTCSEVSAYPETYIKEYFLGLKQYLDIATPDLKRLSIVFESLTVHDIFQDELFAQFPYQE